MGDICYLKTEGLHVTCTICSVMVVSRHSGFQFWQLLGLLMDVVIIYV